ncbi:uncharacterized protein F5147DRAFT_656629 [Suillus discolor]|uniref:Uncharacterized protein n=1 Tax=Suillus discolor TaxID=1912936 RepID=A0A9P7EZ76_9AGAM|nr:uncharacterized protein F5147DRAFT_656629 [Suillus discolor]KAG2096314.1 hypothetical protein F5147DRAFT_656629 [Suillus discolor]
MSSPGVPPISHIFDSSDDKSMHDSAHTQRRRDNSSRRMRTIDSSSPRVACLPPVIYHMSCYAKCASSRFKPYQPGKHVPTALEHRFLAKNILKHNEADISLIDVQQGKEIFNRSMQYMSNATLRSAAIAKRADAESKCLHALAPAWDLESTERHAVLLQMILKDNAEHYLDSLAEATFFESVMVKRSHQQLEDDADFTIAAYTHDITAHSIADKQLDHLEEIGAERNLSLEDPVGMDSEDVEHRFDKYLDSIIGEGNNMIMCSAILIMIVVQMAVQTDHLGIMHVSDVHPIIPLSKYVQHYFPSQQQKKKKSSFISTASLFTTIDQDMVMIL